MFSPAVGNAGNQYNISGGYDFRLLGVNNASDQNSDYNDSQTYADLRLRLRTDAAINENAKGVVTLETGHTIFGIDQNGESANAPGSDSINLKLKNAYVDFILPNKESNFRVGLQPFYIFDGLLANEDAFGVNYIIEADRKLGVNYIRILDDGVGDEYSNETNPDRRSELMSLYYEDTCFITDTYSLLFGYYIDRNASIESFDRYAANIEYSKRDMMIFGFGYKWGFYGVDMSLNWLYESGKKRYADPETGANSSNKLLAYLFDIIAKKSFRDYDLNFEILYATGDDNFDNDKDTEFMTVDGLSNYYDRAYIMTGYISQDDADEKEGIYNTDVYNLKNVAFFRLGTEYKYSPDYRVDAAIMYALNNQRRQTSAGNSSRDIGAELDVTLSIDIFDTYYKNNEGLLFKLFGAYFQPGKNYERYDGAPSDAVYLGGTALEYRF